jgi:hypothetical protein
VLADQPDEVPLVCADTNSADAVTSAQTHANCKTALANQNFDVFMRLVISQQAQERNTLGTAENTAIRRLFQMD